ncbi:MAG: glycosyl hydrolase family 18 protein [Candidatus Limnocylindrales bacterium]
MKSLRLPLIVALALAVALPVVNAPTPAQAASAKVAPGQLRALTTKQISHRLSGEVYGFLPYWLETSGTAGSLRYDLLSTVSLFDIGLTPRGSVDKTWPGYRTLMSPASTAVITAAHAAGDRVDVTLASFGYADNRAFLRNSHEQRRAIAQVVALVIARGLDGVTVDFESVYRRDLPDLGRFVDALGRAIRAHNPIGRVTVAVGASQAGVAMAAAALAGHADRVLIMGYDYRGSRSTTTGSTDPLVRADGGMSLTWSLDLFTAARLPMNRILLALPYYGMSWPTKSKGPGSAPAKAAYQKAPAYPIRLSKISVAKGARHGYDTIEATAWVATYDAHLHVWRITYFDNARSLTTKYNLAKGRGLAGIGIWALGYDAGSAANWQAIATVYRPAPKPAKPPKTVKKVVHKKTPKTVQVPKAKHTLTVPKHSLPAGPAPTRKPGPTAV